MEDIVRFDPSDDNGKMVECPCPFVAAYMKKIEELQRNYRPEIQEMVDKDDDDEIHYRFRDLGGWMDNQQVSVAFNLSKKTLQDMRSDRRIAYSKFGSKIVYYRGDITKMLKRNYRDRKR